MKKLKYRILAPVIAAVGACGLLATIIGGPLFLACNKKIRSLRLESEGKPIPEEDDE